VSKLTNMQIRAQIASLEQGVGRCEMKGDERGYTRRKEKLDRYVAELAEREAAGSDPRTIEIQEVRHGEPRPKFTKLIDIHDQAVRLHQALEKYLAAHRIEWRVRRFAGDGFVRYAVRPADLCCAQAVLPALRELAEVRP